MKNFYFVVGEEIDGKRCAYVDKVNQSLNICRRWESSQYEVVMPCESKKKAEQIADAWNASYKANGKYLFD